MRNARILNPFHEEGGGKSGAAWSRDPRCVVSYGMLMRRLQLGWDEAKAITTPMAANKSSLARPVEVTAVILGALVAGAQTSVQLVKAVAAAGHSSTGRALQKLVVATVDHLVKQGKVQRTGRGVYALVEGYEPPAQVGKPVKLYYAYDEWKTLPAWAADPRCKVSRTALRYRLAHGMTLEEAMSGKPNAQPDFAPKKAWDIEAPLADLVRDERCVAPYQVVHRRISEGWDVTQALTTPMTTYGTIDAFGESCTPTAWSKHPRARVSASTIVKRLEQGWEPEAAISTPFTPMMYDAWGQSRSLPELMQDPRTVVRSIGTVHTRIHENGMSVEDALTTPLLSIRSHAETNLAAWVEEMGVGIECNTRSVIHPHEIDIYIPEKRLGIEFHGLRWHSEEYVDRDYHHAKWKACQAAGVRLIQIWEDDYMSRPDVVRSMLVHKLGLSTERVYARKTSVGEVRPEAAKAFLDTHHIQGGATATVHIGLHHGEDLVAVCSFTREGTKWLLTRYATSVSVPGGFTKCLSYFRSHYDWTEIKTFADLCVSDGDLYRKAGFENDGMIPPDYSYVVDSQRVHKFNYRLDRFRRDPDLVYVEGMTERELAELNGLSRIWDAGKIRWVMRAAWALLSTVTARCYVRRHDYLHR